MSLKGNELAQTVAGNEGANTIDGGAGSDVQIGGGGADRFAFTTALGPNNVDVIADFQLGTDKIGLSQSIFGMTSFTAAAFTTGTERLPSTSTSSTMPLPGSCSTTPTAVGQGPPCSSRWSPRTPR